MSKPGELKKADWLKILKGALLAGAGAAGAALISVLGGLDWGAMGPTMAALLAVAANLLRKYVTEQPEQ